MCGIAGAWRFGGASEERLRQEAGGMIDRLAHRGPDDRGVWTDPANGIALANRRLAILDLSPLGHQPMASADGRIVIAFNGEIYNHAALRLDLEAQGHRFRGRSDTEVLVEALARWGIAGTLPRLNGMFALAVWETGPRRLTLVRDRLGEKPLYWGRSGGCLLFGSELKALRAHPALSHPTLDTGALAAYLRLGHVPAPLAILAGIRQLPPGGLVRVAADGGVTEDIWWSAQATAAEALADPLGDDADAALERLRPLLDDAVTLRLAADVAVGVFLSGGIDSSLVAARMQVLGARPVRSFTIAFAERDHDESAAAAAVAAHLGTDHMTLPVGPADALAMVPDLAEIFDEPFADSSQIPTLLLARLARSQVTVALTGDGGDEGFAGYSRHLWAARLERLRRLPAPVRALLGGGLQVVPPGVWDALVDRIPGAPRQPGDKLHKAAAALAARDADALYASLLARWPAPGQLLAAGDAAMDPGPPLLPSVPGADPALRMQVADAVTYLASGVLVKVDRATMAASLEARPPLLDHRLVAFGWGLPPSLRLGGGRGTGGQGKVLLRRLLAEHLPPTLIDRPKSGFRVPLAAWLRGPLRGWAEDLLAPTGLAAAGLRPEPVRKAWAEHLSGRRDRAERLWTVLAYLGWYRRWM